MYEYRLGELAEYCFGHSNDYVQRHDAILENMMQVGGVEGEVPLDARIGDQKPFASNRYE